MSFLKFYFCNFSTWSTVSRSNSDTGWPDSTTNDITPDSKDSQWSSSQPPANAFADIIPEFEPGKPWKVRIDYFFIMIFFKKDLF